ncbi:MAG: hypothetical protein DELT_02942 [Desulfovibrio sp.]
MHKSLPKTFRFTVGEDLLRELTACLRHVVIANEAGRESEAERREGAAALKAAKTNLETARAFFTLAWELKLISHQSAAIVNGHIDNIARQAEKWRQWFERGEEPLP